MGWILGSLRNSVVSIILLFKTQFVLNFFGVGWILGSPRNSVVSVILVLKIKTQFFGFLVCDGYWVSE